MRGLGTPEKACRLVGLLRNLHTHEGGIGQGWEKLVGEEIIWGTSCLSGLLAQASEPRDTTRHHRSSARGPIPPPGNEN